jgi:cell division septation protein DedD
MQVAFTPSTPAEARLVAAFMVDYADLLELNAPAPLVGDQTTGSVQAEKPKRTRRAVSAETSQPDPAPAATQPAPEPAPAETASAPESPSEITVDQLRVLFGELSQANKREQAVALVRQHGFNSIREITDDKRTAIYGQLKALL